MKKLGSETTSAGLLPKDLMLQDLVLQDLLSGLSTMHWLQQIAYWLFMVRCKIFIMNHHAMYASYLLLSVHQALSPVEQGQRSGGPDPVRSLKGSGWYVTA